MFQLSLVDHIRLSFGHVVYTYRAHARVAERLALRAAQMRAAILTLTGVATATTALALGGDRRIQIAAAVSAGLAFALSRSAWRSISSRAPTRTAAAPHDCGCSVRSTGRCSRRCTTGSSTSLSSLNGVTR